MDALRRLAQLLRHPAFRRLVAVRTLSQGGDAVVQVGMAAYILFSPQTQPNAWAIAAVIALVMLPFSVVGPFVSPILDRFPRQRIVVVCDLIRLVLAIASFVVVVSGGAAGSRQVLLFGLLLVILGLNRLQLAALGAGMPHTVAANEYLEAAAIMPMVGPISGMIGGLLAGGLRLASGRLLSPAWADSLVFA
ncbi:MAG: MFS transporter, partial [Brooklawnia sp.]